MKKFALLIPAIIALIVCSACFHKGGTDAEVMPGDTLSMRYAHYVSIVKYPDFIKADVRNPWDTMRVLHTYVLVEKSKSLPDSLPKGTVVRTPLSKSLVYSSVHCSLLSELGAENAIGGVCDLSYISLPFIQEGCRQGKITDAGNSMNPTIEKVIEMQPDAILLSPFENSGGYGRIEKLGIPIIECADYMELSPLGRAEWMRFFGLLYGKETQADSLFNNVETAYCSLCDKVKDVKERKTVFSELKSSSAWYVPGGKSTMARLFADAGADYIFSDTQQSGSIPLSFETVLDRAQKADFWLIKYNQSKDKTYSELKSDYEPYTRFEAYKKRCVYGCNTGRILFYENTPFHPERLLKDLISVFYPEKLEGYVPVYFSKLAD